jgi:hypothetical protein
VKVLLRSEIAQVGAVYQFDNLFLNFFYRLHHLVRVRVTALANVCLLRVHVVWVCVWLRHIANPIRPIVLSRHKLVTRGAFEIGGLFLLVLFEIASLIISVKLILSL